MANISVTINNGVLRLTLNRPEKKNAINPEMYETIIAQLNNAAIDDAIRVVLISAEGDYFSAGNDREGFKTVRNMPHKDRPGFRFMNTLAGFPKPVIAAVNGHAIGIAATLLLHCDLIYAASGVELKMPFINIGLLPEFGSTLLLPKMLGYCRAAEILMLGDPVTADKAAGLGLINRVIAAENLEDFTRDICERLSAKPPESLLTLKRLLKKADLSAVINTIEDETIEINRCLLKLP